MNKHKTISPFQRTRNDHATETTEDYVEAIADLISLNGYCRITDLAQQFSVSHVTALKIVRRLERDGFVLTKSRRPITLTPKGKTLAKHCRERHEIVFEFLRAIGVSKKTAKIDSTPDTTPDMYSDTYSDTEGLLDGASQYE